MGLPYVIIKNAKLLVQLLRVVYRSITGMICGVGLERFVEVEMSTGG